MNLNTLFYPARLHIFSQIAQNDLIHASAVAKQSEMSYAHTTKTILILEQLELVHRIDRLGKKKIRLTLTEKGQRIWSHLSRLMEVLKNEN